MQADPGRLTSVPLRPAPGPGPTTALDSQLTFKHAKV